MPDDSLLPSQFRSTIDHERKSIADDQPTAATEKSGDQIGPYTLLKGLGQGGMGAVWLAEQREPVRRQVALKVIRSGMASDSVVARFEAERQALALMDHPNIAKVFDAGTTSTGRPYFVMELVHGIPITKYCDQERLTIRQRFELMIPVCQAVQHAHQKGIIHRDLKPSNILVGPYDGTPVPKIIDFGVAKATGPALLDQSMHTMAGAIIGTLEYMAPEQAGATHLDIDTRSDIYSLGVVLYELATGAPPFSRRLLRSAALEEMLRMIREVEPSKPSTKLATAEELPSLAATRGMEPRRLTSFVRGDLDWIVMKCLEKDRERRYETANGLANDIHRYLADEPVSAGPPSRIYRTRKFIRRHRGGVAAIGTALALLVGGTVGTTWGMVRASAKETIARTERDRAIEARNVTREALDAMVSEATGDSLATQRNLSSEQKRFLNRVVTYYEAFAAEPGEGRLGQERLANVCFRLGLIRYRLGQRQEGLEVFQRSAALFGALAAEHPKAIHYRKNLAKSYNVLGNLYRLLERREDSKSAYASALALQAALVAEAPNEPEYRRDLAGSHSNLGIVLYELGDQDEAEAAHKMALTIRARLAAEYPANSDFQQDLAVNHSNLGNFYYRQSRKKDAESSYRTAIGIQERLALEPSAPASHRHLFARSNYNLGNLLYELSRLPDASAAFRTAMAELEKLSIEFPTIPEYLQDLADTSNNLGNTLRRLGQRGEAEAAHRTCIAVNEKLANIFPANAEYRQAVGRGHFNVGIVYVELGDRQAAETAFAASLVVRGRLVLEFPAVANYHQDLAATYTRLGQILKELDRGSESSTALMRAAAALGQILKKDPDSAEACLLRADIFSRTQDYSKAVAEISRLEATERLNSQQAIEGARIAAIVSAKSRVGSEQFGSVAMKLLRRAVALGYHDFETLKSDSSFQTLRLRDEFQALLKELQDKEP